MRHHDDYALALVDVFLEAVFVFRAFDDVGVHPFAVEAGRAHHFDAGDEKIGEALDGYRFQFAARFLREHASEAFEGALSFQAQDLPREGRGEAGEGAGRRVRQGVHDGARGAYGRVFCVYGETAFLLRHADGSGAT